MGRESESSSFMGLLPFVGMVVLECFDVGLTTISKAAMSRGMSHYVAVVYANAIATLILFPASYLVPRSKRAPVTLPLLCKFFILGLFGITVMQNCVFTGVSYSSPTLGSAMGQLIPAFTFMLAVIFGMEKLDLRSIRSQVKIMGTMVSISGALMVIFYKGPSIGDAGTQSEPSPAPPSLSTPLNPWVIGGFFFAIACLSISIFNTFQAAVLKEYPSELTIVSFYSLFGTIQCAIVSLVAERDPDAWKLAPDIELISIVYSAIFGNVMTAAVVTWCIRKKGPVFVAMFKPLGIAIAAFLGVIFLGDTLYVGSIIGAAVIVAGFYGVIWAQSKEEAQDEASKITRPELPRENIPSFGESSGCVIHCNSFLDSKIKQPKTNEKLQKLLLLQYPHSEGLCKNVSKLSSIRIIVLKDGPISQSNLKVIL